MTNTLSEKQKIAYDWFHSLPSKKLLLFAYYYTDAKLTKLEVLTHTNIQEIEEMYDVRELYEETFNKERKNASI